MAKSKNETVLVTGATSGLGLALILDLKAAGYKPILTGRNQKKVDSLAKELGVDGYMLDVSNAETIEKTLNQIENEAGPIWGLVNNAGIWLEGDFEKYSIEKITDVFNTNTLGTILMTHAILPHMIKRGAGTILNVVSTGALYTRKSISVYSSSKWAIRGFTGCMEAEFAPQGIRVMGFYPGKISSNMYQTAGIDRDLEIAMTPEQGSNMIMTLLNDENMVWAHVSGRALTDYV